MTMPAHPEPDGHFGPSRVGDRTIALINAAGLPAVTSPTAATVSEILRDYGEIDPEVSESEIPALVDVARQLHAACAATTDRAAAQALNTLFATYARAPRLTNHDSTRWHLHLDTSDDAPLHEWVAASGALALATLFAEWGRNAWGICRAQDCGRVFLRTGTMRRRAACSERCATRARVRAHRQRQPS